MSCKGALFPGQVVPNKWSGCKIRAQTGVGSGNNCDVVYAGIIGKHCQITGVMRVVTPNSTVSNADEGASEFATISRESQ